MGRLIDLIGREFGGLRVVQRGPAYHTGHAAWICRCVGCGRHVEVLSHNLREDRVRSCGSSGCKGRFPLPSPDREQAQ